MSSSSLTTMLVDSESIDAAPGFQEKADATQKADVAEPGKSASAKPAPAKATPTSIAPAKASPEKPATGEPARRSGGILDGFLFAEWGWMTPSPVDRATVEAARDFQKKQEEKRSS